jgi:hypothetical protein
VRNIQFAETITNEVETLRQTATRKKFESNELKEAEEARIRGGRIRTQILSKSESSLESRSEAPRMTAANALKLSNDKSEDESAKKYDTANEISPERSS